MVPLLLAGLAFWPLLFDLAQAVLINITVDDAGSDPRSGHSIVYNPPSVWNTQSHCQAAVCNAIPSVKTVFDGTWHEATFDPQTTHTPITATFEFEGSAVYVYCVLATSVIWPSGKSEMRFSIDGQPVGTFARNPPGPWGYEYNTLVYSNSALSPGSHKLEIMNGNIGTTNAQTLLMLDHIVYSVDDQASTRTTTILGPGPAVPPERGGSVPSQGPTATAPGSLTTESSPPSNSPVPSEAGTSLSNQPDTSASTSSILNPDSPTDPTSLPPAGGTSPTSPTSLTGSFVPSQPSGSSFPSFTPKPLPSSSSSRNRIIGAIVGTLLGVLTLALLLVCLYWRRYNRKRLSITTDDRSSFGVGTSPLLESPHSAQVPSPVYTRRAINFAGAVSPMNSPVSPGGVDPFPFPLYNGHNRGSGVVGHQQMEQRWTVGSDVKRPFWEPDGPPPPAYR